ncbi:MAG: 2Fe-2S iron-sulfur cluster-binding protein [Burkholderiales bacterium]
MHDVLEIGDTLEISHPRNHFPLAQDGTNYLLIAGGIGVTPLLSMAKELASRGAPFSFLYCARTRERSAYIDQLEALCTKGQLALHFDGGDPKRQFDIRSLVQSAGRDTHVYCCGPTSLMKAVRDCTREWSPRTVHFEDFSSGNSNGQFEDDGFEIVLRKRGIKLVVPPGKSIVRVLLEHGVQVDTSCEAGTCGTCRTRYLSGNPIHNDFVLTEQEQSQFVMICCARATDTPLVLDL